MTWEDLVAFLDGAQITGVTFEGYWDDSAAPKDFHPLAPAYLATDRGLLRIAETSHSSGTLWCHVVDAPTYEDYADLRDEASPNLGVLELGFGLLGLDVSDAAVRGLRCVYGVGAPHDGRILAMAVLADNDEAVTFNAWYYLGLRVTAGDSLEKILTTNQFLSDVPATIRTWTRFDHLC